MKRALFALALAAALPMSAQASELSYSFVEVDFNEPISLVIQGAVVTETYIPLVVVDADPATAHAKFAVCIGSTYVEVFGKAE